MSSHALNLTILFRMGYLFCLQAIFYAWDAVSSERYDRSWNATIGLTSLTLTADYRDHCLCIYAVKMGVAIIADLAAVKHSPSCTPHLYAFLHFLYCLALHEACDWSETPASADKSEGCSASYGTK